MSMPALILCLACWFALMVFMVLRALGPARTPEHPENTGQALGGHHCDGLSLNPNPLPFPTDLKAFMSWEKARYGEWMNNLTTSALRQGGHIEANFWGPERRNVQLHHLRHGWNETGSSGFATKRMELLRVLHCERPAHILEIGSNAGHSAVLFLTALPAVHLHSVDMCVHKYTRTNLHHVAKAFPGRYSYGCGPSQKQLPKLWQKKNRNTYDVILVDGDHSAIGAFNDISNTRPLSTPQTLLVMDDCNLKCPPAQGKAERRDIKGCMPPTESFRMATRKQMVAPLNVSMSLDPQLLNCYARYRP